ncbi:MAG: hypothetical protein IJ165_10625 [Proteobacteria bacterium]|nr:hypothetical protein [Pseudomonadota bacterium]
MRLTIFIQGPAAMPAAYAPARGYRFAIRRAKIKKPGVSPSAIARPKAPRIGQWPIAVQSEQEII